MCSVLNTQSLEKAGHTVLSIHAAVKPCPLILGDAANENVDGEHLTNGEGVATATTALGNTCHASE